MPVEEEVRHRDYWLITSDVEGFQCPEDRRREYRLASPRIPWYNLVSLERAHLGLWLPVALLTFDPKNILKAVLVCGNAVVFPGQELRIVKYPFRCTLYPVSVASIKGVVDMLVIWRVQPSFDISNSISCVAHLALASPSKQPLTDFVLSLFFRPKSGQLMISFVPFFFALFGLL